MISDKQILDQQLTYLSRLQAIQPDRPILVQRVKYVTKCKQCFNLRENARSNSLFCNGTWQNVVNAADSLPGWCPLPGNGTKLDLSLAKMWQEWHSVWSTQPLLTCSLLTNEVAFDPDLRDWPVLRKEVNKLCSFMDSEKIPYLLSWSGGKGVHIETFFDKDTIVPDDIGEGINEYQIDVGRVVRVLITNWILDNADVDADVIKLDWSKIKWTTKSKGSMIRIFGCKRESGGNKTLIETMPEEQPLPEVLPLRFPGYIKIWNIARLRDEIILALQSEIDKCIPEEQDPFEAWLTDQTEKARGEGRIKYRTDCTGFTKAIKGGITEGHRDEVATGIVYYMRFWKKETIEKTLKTVQKWCNTCSPPLDFRGRSIDRKIENIYKKSKMDYSPCTFLIKAGLCSVSGCSVIRRYPPHPYHPSSHTNSFS